MKFYSPIDMGFLEIVQFRTQNSTAQPYSASGIKGAFWMDTSVNLLKWSDGTSWNAIYPFSDVHVPGVVTGVLRSTTGTITANLTGVASKATQLETARNFSITGKATAAAVSFDGTGAVALNVTALSVAPAEISITNGSFLLGGATGFGVATAKNAIPLSGFGAAAADVAMGGFKLTNLADPTLSTDAATKGYVDSTAQGLEVKTSCRVATAVGLPANTFASNTITASAVGALTVDGVAVVAGDRVLVKNEATYQNNGIYVVTNAGSASAAFVLTRAADFDTSAEASPGSFTFIEEGSTLADTGWVMTSNAPITLNTTSIFWAQFSGAGSIIAGYGLARSGTTLNFFNNSGWTAGDLFYGATATTLGALAGVATGNVLLSGGVGAAPSWGKVSYAAIQQIAGLSVFGNSTASAATGGAITGTANQVMRVDSAGTSLGFGAVNLASAAAVTGVLPAGNGGTGTQYAQFTGPTVLRTYSLPNLNSQLAAQVSGTITGNSSSAQFNGTHNLNTKNVVVTVFDSSDNQIGVDTKTLDANTVQFTFGVAPTTGTTYRWVVVGY